MTNDIVSSRVRLKMSLLKTSLSSPPSGGKAYEQDPRAWLYDVTSPNRKSTMKPIHRKIIRLQVAKVDKLIGDIKHWKKAKSKMFANGRNKNLFTSSECRTALEHWGEHAVPAAHKDAMWALSVGKKCKVLRRLIKLTMFDYGNYYETKVILLGELGIYPQFILDKQK